MFKFAPLLALAALSTTVTAQEVAAPELKANDSWVYRHTYEVKPDGWKQSRLEITVVRASGKTALVDMKEPGSTHPPAEQLVGSDWSRFRNVNGRETVVNRPLSFPLTANKTWDLDYHEDSPNPQHKSETIDVKFQVMGWEDVEVPAGKFKALKIEGDGHWTAEIAPRVASLAATQADTGGATAIARSVNVKAETSTGRLYKAFWYAPEVKRFVKDVEEFYDASGSRNERFSDELESYKVAPMQ